MLHFEHGGVATHTRKRRLGVTKSWLPFVIKDKNKKKKIKDLAFFSSLFIPTLALPFGAGLRVRKVSVNFQQRLNPLLHAI